MANTPNGDLRLVRLPLPATLVRSVDELVLRGAGGYESRLDFMKDAIHNAVLEFQFPQQPIARTDDVMITERTAQVPSRDAKRGSLVTTELRLLSRPFVLTTNDAAVEDAPLLGLHNRDYPTLWAAQQLATIAKTEPIEIERALREVIERAWHFGEYLASLEQRDGQRYTALFPTNPEKRASSEANFRSFAIGRYFLTAAGLKAAGPIFQWRLCGITRIGREVGIALLPDAVELLENLAGISAGTPHSEQHARTFLQHLADRSQADWKAFQFVLGCVSKKPNRSELIAKLRKAGLGTTPQQGSGYAAGYVARAREWGLIEPKLIYGRYALSSLGETMSQQFSSLKVG